MSRSWIASHPDRAEHHRTALGASPRDRAQGGAHEPSRPSLNVDGFEESRGHFSTTLRRTDTAAWYLILLRGRLGTTLANTVDQRVF